MGQPMFPRRACRGLIEAEPIGTPWAAPLGFRGVRAAASLKPVLGLHDRRHRAGFRGVRAAASLKLVHA